MVLVVFRSRLNHNLGKEYEELSKQMYELGSNSPGFISFKTFTSSDDERVSIIEFDSEKSAAAWGNNPDHIFAQKLGRETFYKEYKIQVCTPIRTYQFPSDTPLNKEK